MTNGNISRSQYKKLCECGIGEVVTIDGIQYIQVEEHNVKKCSCAYCAFGGDSICYPTVADEVPCKYGTIFKLAADVIGGNDD